MVTEGRVPHDSLAERAVIGGLALAGVLAWDFRDCDGIRAAPVPGPAACSTAVRTASRPPLRVITVRYHSLRAWFRRMADFGLWMSPQNPHKSASAAGGPHKNSTYKTALPGTRRHGR